MLYSRVFYRGLGKETEIDIANLLRAVLGNGLSLHNSGYWKWVFQDRKRVYSSAAPTRDDGYTLLLHIIRRTQECFAHYQLRDLVTLAIGDSKLDDFKKGPMYKGVEGIAKIYLSFAYFILNHDFASRVKHASIPASLRPKIYYRERYFNGGLRAGHSCVLRGVCFRRL